MSQARTGGAPDPPTPRDRVRRVPLLKSIGPLLGLVVVWTLFALLNGGAFIQWDNQRIMLLQTAVVGTAAIGATLIIVSGGLDLSVGSTIALGTMVVALLLEAGASPGVAALGGIVAGALTGLVIGSLVVGYTARVAAPLLGVALAAALWGSLGATKASLAGAGACVVLLGAGETLLRRLPLSPFIVTLGMWGALRGLAKGLGNNSPIYPADIGWLNSLMQLWRPAREDVPLGPVAFARAFLAHSPGADLNADGAFGAADILQFALNFLHSIPIGVWICLAVALLMTALLRATPFGVQAYAIGSNELAARSCGVRIERSKVLIYALGVACAGLAAVLQFSFLTVGDPTTAQGYELRVIAAVVIGGASLSGGEGTVRGTLIGAIIMTVVDNGCAKYGIDNWIQEIVTGAIIVAAVGIDRLRRRPDE